MSRPGIEPGPPRSGANTLEFELLMLLLFGTSTVLSFEYLPGNLQENFQNHVAQILLHG